MKLEVGIQCDYRVFVFFFFFAVGGEGWKSNEIANVKWLPYCLPYIDFSVKFIFLLKLIFLPQLSNNGQFAFNDRNLILKSQCL